MLSFQPIGDQAVCIRLGDRIEPSVHDRVRRWCRALERQFIPGVIEWVPSYTAVTVLYRPAEVSYQQLIQLLERLAEQLDEEPLPQPRIISLPVCYGGEYGPDLEALAELCGKTPEEVVRIHSSAEYVVYMMGFAPDFPISVACPKRLLPPDWQRRDHRYRPDRWELPVNRQVFIRFPHRAVGGSSDERRFHSTIRPAIRRSF